MALLTSPLNVSNDSDFGALFVKIREMAIQKAASSHST